MPREQDVREQPGQDPGAHPRGIQQQRTRHHGCRGQCRVLLLNGWIGVFRIRDFFLTDPDPLDPYTGLRIRIWNLIRLRILLFSSVALKMPTKNIFHSVFLLITYRTFGVDPDPDLDPRI